jgi:hypothetical protein
MKRSQLGKGANALPTAAIDQEWWMRAISPIGQPSDPKEGEGGARDGARTRDLRRDRPAL